MSIPRDEEQYYAQAAEQERAQDVDAVDTDKQAEQERAAAAKRSTDRSMRDAAKAVLAADPALWQVLADRVTPRPGRLGMLMVPDADMTFAELAAYRMGQQSIVDWLVSLSQMEVDDG